MGVTVTAPDGRTWVVSRTIQWPHKRWKGIDFPDGPVSGGDLGVFTFVVVAICAAIIIVWLLPFIVLAVEAVIVLAASIVFRRAWAVTAWTNDAPRETKEWAVRGGYFRTRAAVREVADELRRGVEAAP